MEVAKWTFMKVTVNVIDSQAVCSKLAITVAMANLSSQATFFNAYYFKDLDTTFQC